MPDNQDAGLITPETAARLLMIEQAELDKAVKKGFIPIARERPKMFLIVAVVQGWLKWLKRPRTAQECADELDVNVRTFQRYGYPQLPEGGYDLDAVRRLDRQRLEASSSGRGDELMAERTRLAKEQGDAIALKNSIARGDFVSLASIMKTVRGI